jgi:hypothetical protein
MTNKLAGTESALGQPACTVHGNPFSASALQDHALHKELIQSVLDSAPNFSPLKRSRLC